MPPLSRIFITACCCLSSCVIDTGAVASSNDLAAAELPTVIHSSRVKPSIAGVSTVKKTVPIDRVIKIETNLAADADQPTATCLAAEFISWVQGADVQRWLREYNAHSALVDVKALDAAWPHLNSDSHEIQTVLQHPAAAALHAFQNHYSVLGESFLIGANGGLVAATDRTSDYWQGDEAQFLDTVQLQADSFKLFTAGLDESAHAMLAKLAIPIYDNEHRTADDDPIGVLVLGFDQVVVDFERPCRK